jgi:hypothetical protein
MSAASSACLTLVLATSSLLLSGGRVQAMDCPCTWEGVICQADAVAEVEMVLATKTTPDHMEIKRVIWNRTNHRIRPNLPERNYLRYALKPRIDLVSVIAEDRRQHHPPEQRETVSRYRRALKRGSYRSIVIIKRYDDGSWFGGGVAYIDGVQWLDHPKHAEWWAKVQPFLRQHIEADKRHEEAAFCANVVDRLNSPTQLRM